MSQHKPAEDVSYTALGRALGAIIEDAVYRGVRRALAETGMPRAAPADVESAQLTLDPELAYSVAEVAAYLKCSRDMIYALIRSGQLRGRKLGMQRAVRIMGSAVLEYMSGRDEL